MKLLTKTSRIYLFASLAIYLVVGIAFYWIVKSMIYDEVESRLLMEKRDFIFFIRTHDNWNANYYFVANKIDVTPVKGEFNNNVVFKDTAIVNKYDNSSFPFREITFYTHIGDIMHKVSIRKSMLESHKLIKAISALMIAFLGLLIIIMYLFQRRLSGSIWEPFYQTLAKIKEFDLTKKDKLELPPSEITEFTELEDVLKKMADKMQHDYTSLREFTENASHEIQTPLAVINARVEQFIQSKDLNETHTYWIEEIYRASRKMSRLNQGLLLLAKIENQQFGETLQLNFTDLLSLKQVDFEDILYHKGITWRTAFKENFWQEMSPALAEILLNNLISNAVRHNYTGGEIILETDANSVCIKNTGADLKGDPERLFERFKKESATVDSIGLGLAIVKQICENYHLGLAYHYEKPIHSILIYKLPLESNG